MFVSECNERVTNSARCSALEVKVPEDLTTLGDNSTLERFVLHIPIDSLEVPLLVATLVS